MIHRLSLLQPESDFGCVYLFLHEYLGDSNYLHLHTTHGVNIHLVHVWVEGTAAAAVEDPSKPELRVRPSHVHRNPDLVLASIFVIASVLIHRLSSSQEQEP